LPSAPNPLREFAWQPEDFGVHRSPLDSLTIEGPTESARMIRAVLAGHPGPARDIVVLNAAAGLIAIGQASQPKHAAQLAADAIDSGAANQRLADLVKRSHEPA
jgi:anthranilate phosphoribosyltransferase